MIGYQPQRRVVTSRPPISTDLFSTTFPTIEAPISQGNIWQRGLQEGTSWQDPKVTANGCVATHDTFTPPASRFQDDIGHLKKSFIDFADNQYAEGVLYVASGYTGNGGFHECELLLRFEITSGNARGYEVITGMGPGGLAYMAAVKWEGGLGSYTALWDTQVNGGPPDFPVDGLIVRAEIIGTNLLVYRNGTLFHTVDITKDTAGGDVAGTWTEGQPGLGFWPADDTPGIGGIPENMGWKSYRVGNI